MNTKRIKPGEYLTDCGRFQIVKGQRNQWDRKQVWKLVDNGQLVNGYRTLDLARKAAEKIVSDEALALAAGQLANQRRECIASAETCPSGVDWLEWHNLRTGDDWTREKLADQHETLARVAKLETLLDANDLGEYTVGQYVDTYLADEYQQTNRGSSVLYCGQAVIVLEFCEDYDRATVAVNGDAFHYSYPTSAGSEYETAARAVADMVMDSTEEYRTLATILAIEPGSEGYRFTIVEKMGTDGQPAGEPITADNFPALFSKLSRAVA